MSKPTKTVDDPDLRPEYDFSSLQGGVRGKYFERYRAGVNLVLLEPEVAQALPTDAAVNDALRKVSRSAKASRREHALPDQKTLRTRRAQAKRPRR
jgi:hypothetical protein